MRLSTFLIDRCCRCYVQFDGPSQKRLATASVSLKRYYQLPKPGYIMLVPNEPVKSLALLETLRHLRLPYATTPNSTRSHNL